MQIQMQHYVGFCCLGSGGLALLYVPCSRRRLSVGGLGLNHPRKGVRGPAGACRSTGNSNTLCNLGLDTFPSRIGA